ncbi:hypothetical protein CH276_06890 [Rhodococcus sp. 06-470-2]|uniref:hypothetical protein n=1 Tax=unclassified Rhodococcus (in: high G+C Gram-positive bacteria) TaxID=192944 RepID=UPI000B9A8C06|nr:MULTISPECIES: hypothetical protein [unclassified Rhodococcus (in: high G+C Gram-positive bacteria)]OZC66933.1 hypothetical protein CH276_06890 [Rhodococcus sp. 06-470-2]OZE58605.1 hypothetical protein CH265_21175 [Rhodococcus sp. 05-2221-1B]
MGTANGAASPAPRDDNYAVNLEQARVFARGLAEHIETCSASIELAQSEAFRARADRAESRARAFESEASTLRTELYEMYRHIDAMTARFPELRSDPSVRG